MNALHLIMSSGRDAVEDCRLFVRPGDLLLLVDAGVDLLWDEQRVAQLMELVRPGRVRASGPDVEARGLSNRAGAVSVPVLTDAQWVDAARTHDPVLSWK